MAEAACEVLGRSKRPSVQLVAMQHNRSACLEFLGERGLALVAQHPLPDARCPMPAAQCPLPNAQCPMPNAQCPMPNAQCPMQAQCRPSAQCPMAQCSLEPAQCSLVQPSAMGPHAGGDRGGPPPCGIDAAGRGRRSRWQAAGGAAEAHAAGAYGGLGDWPFQACCQRVARRAQGRSATHGSRPGRHQRGGGAAAATARRH